MTTRVYFRGDIADSVHLRIFDADTDVELKNVQALQITVDAQTRQTMADLRLIQNTSAAPTNCRAQVVSDPKKLPREFFALQVDYYGDGNEDVHDVHLRSFRSDDGRNVEEGLQLQTTRRTSHSLLQAAYDPIGVSASEMRTAVWPSLEWLADRVLQAKGFGATLTTMPFDPFPPAPPAPAFTRRTLAGNIIPAPPGTYPRVKLGPQTNINVPAPAATCPECYGTGLYKGFGGPCSNGCKP